MKRTNEHRLMKWRRVGAAGNIGVALATFAAEEREERRCEVHRKKVKADA